MLPRINRLCHWCRTLQSWERNITNICIQSTGGFPIKLLPQTTGLDGGEDPNGSLLDKHFVSSAIDWEIVFLLVQVFGHSWLWHTWDQLQISHLFFQNLSAGCWNQLCRLCTTSSLSSQWLETPTWMARTEALGACGMLMLSWFLGVSTWPHQPLVLCWESNLRAAFDLTGLCFSGVCELQPE